jgi:hypothetical protein
MRSYRYYSRPIGERPNPTEPMPPIMPPKLSVDCKESDWIAHNKTYYGWYYDTYPVLKDLGVKLPLRYEALQLFYIKDMEERHLTPLKEYLDCYQFLFEYFVGRITNVINSRGKSWWDYTMSNLPGAITKTFKDIGETITNPFGIPLWLIGVVVALILIKK